METLKHAWDFIWSQPEGRWSLGAILTFILIRELLRSLTNKIPNDAGRRGGEWLARVLSATARAISKLRRERLDGAYSSREEPRQRTQSARSDEPNGFDPYVDRLRRAVSALGRAISKLRRERLHEAYSSREEPRQRTRSAESDEPDRVDFDPYVVLGVSRNASKEDVRAAYRREMASHHPDKVAHLGRKREERAKRKAQAINRAYEELMNSESGE